jgi:hypothetical protein
MVEESSQEIYVGHLLKKTPVPKTADAAQTSSKADHHEELQNIVNNLVKLPGDEPPTKPVKVTRITHNEISAMRVTQSRMPAARVEPVVRTSALIQTFDAFLGLFKPHEKRSHCLTEGHECKHCGRIVKESEADNNAPRGH